MTGATARKLEPIGRVNNLRPEWAGESPRFPPSKPTNQHRQQQWAISSRDPASQAGHSPTGARPPSKTQQGGRQSHPGDRDARTRHGMRSAVDRGNRESANPAPSGFVAARNPNSRTSSFPPVTEIMGIPRPVHAVTSSGPTSLTSLATVRTDSARAGPISPMSLLTHGLLVTYSVAAATSPEQPVVRTSCMEPRQTSRSANHLPL